MSQAIIHPEESLELHVIECLRKSQECRLAVAYLARAGLRTFCKMAGSLLKSGGLRLRVVFQSGDFVTEPDAVQSLIDLGIGAPKDSVQVSWSTDRHFHAKAFGFMPKSASSPVVIVGSANANGKAFGFDSGELCVRLSSSAAAMSAWDAINRMLATGHAVDPPWLKTYRHSFERHRKLMRGARCVRATWIPRRKRLQEHAAFPGSSWQSSFSLCRVHTLPKEKLEAVKKAIEAREPGEPEIPGKHYIWDQRPGTHELPEGKCVMVLWWRAESRPSEGLESISIVIPSKPIPLASPTSGRVRWWLIPYTTVRGTQVHPQKRRNNRVSKILYATTREGLGWLYARDAKPRRVTRAKLVKFHSSVWRERVRLQH